MARNLSDQFPLELAPTPQGQGGHATGMQFTDHAAAVSLPGSPAGPGAGVADAANASPLPLGAPLTPFGSDVQKPSLPTPWDSSSLDAEDVLGTPFPPGRHPQFTGYAPPEEL